MPFYLHRNVNGQLAAPRARPRPLLEALPSAASSRSASALPSLAQPSASMMKLITQAAEICNRHVVSRPSGVSNVASGGKLQSHGAGFEQMNPVSCCWELEGFDALAAHAPTDLAPAKTAKKAPVNSHRFGGRTFAWPRQ